MLAVARSPDSPCPYHAETFLVVFGQPLADYAVSRRPSADPDRPVYPAIEPHLVADLASVGLRQALAVRAVPPALLFEY